MGNINVPVLLIGDSAFRLSSYVMKPYPHKVNQPPVEKNFNYFLSKCRRVIENAFGQLKGRFRKIGKGLENDEENWNSIVHACCLLHNFLKDEDDDVSDYMISELVSLSTRSQPGIAVTSGERTVQAKAIRDAIAQHLCKYLNSFYLSLLLALRFHITKNMPEAEILVIIKINPQTIFESVSPSIEF